MYAYVTLINKDYYYYILQYGLHLANDLNISKKRHQRFRLIKQKPLTHFTTGNAVSYGLGFDLDKNTKRIIAKKYFFYDSIEIMKQKLQDFKKILKILLIVVRI